MIKKVKKAFKNPSLVLLYLLNTKIGRLLSDRLYLKIKYRLTMHKKLNLENPKEYDEKLQWLKLYDRKDIYTTISDKYAVRQYIKNAIGEEYLVPILGLWTDPNQIDFNSLPDQFVLKCTHDSGGLSLCKNKATFNFLEAKQKIDKRFRNNYYWGGREWQYRNITPRVIAEPILLDKNGNLPWDYKFMCFEGEPKLLFLDIGVCEFDNYGGHAEEYYRNIYDIDFQPVDMIETRQHYRIDEIKKPNNYDEMVRIVKILCQGFHHCRVDLYNIDGKIYFGEITLHHGSGYNSFEPAEWGKTLGDWIKLS